MVDIIVKDKLRASIEAASGGKQTVLYTAKGQPTYMNILEVFGNSVYGAADGMGATHPAFFYENQVFSRLFIGTYQGTLVNGELLSLPYSDAAALQNANTLAQNLDAARACGRGFHLMTYKEFTAAKYWGLSQGGKNLGNTNNGQDALNHRGKLINDMTYRTLTGSGGYGWSHDGTPSGIMDLAGNAWEYATGIRVYGTELQVQLNEFSYNYESAKHHLENGWHAIDVQTGAFVLPTHTGTLDTTDFRNTTENVIHVVNDKNIVGTHGLHKQDWSQNELQYYTFGSAISDFCKAQLKTFGIIPVSTTVTSNTALLNLTNGNPFTERHMVVGGSPYFESTSGIHSSGSTVLAYGQGDTYNVGRPCFIEI